MGGSKSKATVSEYKKMEKEASSEDAHIEDHKPKTAMITPKSSKKKPKNTLNRFLSGDEFEFNTDRNIQIGNSVCGPGNFPDDITYHICSFLISRNFVFESDFDKNGILVFSPDYISKTKGILYWLGSYQQTAPYQHPLDIGLVKIQPLKFYCGTPKQAFSHDVPVAQNWLEVAVPHSWAEIEFLYHSVIPTAYTLRHGYPIKGHAMRNWELQARNPTENWEVLSKHVDDCTIPGKDMNDTATFMLPSGNYKQYSIFRIYQTGLTSDNSPYLMMSGFEIYGTLFDLA